MRKWHRWLAVFFGLLMVWIAVTGLLSHAAGWWPRPTLTPEQIAAMAPPAGFTCPEGWRCTAPLPPGDARGLAGWFHHLHSGEEFGILGQALSFASGLALVFFAISGMWMYYTMWRTRRRSGTRRKLFW